MEKGYERRKPLQREGKQDLAQIDERMLDILKRKCKNHIPGTG